MGKKSLYVLLVGIFALSLSNVWGGPCCSTPTPTPTPAPKITKYCVTQDATPKRLSRWNFINMLYVLLLPNSQTAYTPSVGVLTNGKTTLSSTLKGGNGNNQSFETCAQYKW